MGDSDPLFELRNLFLIGNYQAAINEGLSITNSSLASNDRAQVERDVLVYRAYVAKGDYSVALTEIKDNAPNALQAVRCLASYMSQEQEIAVATIKDWITDPTLASDDTIQLMAGTIFMLEQNYDSMFKVLQRTNSLEGRALLVQGYIQIARLELARKELAIMQDLDDDATITQLALAWVDIMTGGDKLEEALAIFNEMVDKWSPTPLLLNGMATVYLAMSDKKDHFRSAEKELLQGLEKNANDADTLVNLIACSQHQAKPKEQITRYINQLKARAPSHTWVKALQYKEEAFDLCAARFGPSVASQ